MVLSFLYYKKGDRIFVRHAHIGGSAFMRVFYYFKSYEFFLNKLKFSLFDSQKLNINKKVGEETLKQSSPTNFFLFCQYNRQFIRGPPAFQIEKI